PTEAEEGIPVTYVPARNMIFLSLASAYAEVIGATAVYTGVSAVDYSGYPDCRPEFIQSMEETINLATKAGVTGKNISVETP
ncbi:7-cyano-7-deazaguanine synthase, partial [Vibrio parahaemolyticus]